MLKYWPLLLIMGILAAIVCMSQYADSAKHRHEESARQTKAASVAKGDDCKATNDTKDAYEPPIWAKYVTWPEGVGAWAVILTLLAIAWQSAETHAAAEAALVNAKAFINSERPWISLSIDRVGYGHFKITAVNVGRTPANLISISGEVVPVRNTEQLPNLPTYEREKELRILPRLFSPDHPRIIDEAFTDALPDSVKQDIASGNIRLFYIGSVVYSHVLSGKERIPTFNTNWCYLMSGIDGPAIPGFCSDGYEEHT
jgi:hypothetical protein